MSKTYETSEQGKVEYLQTHYYKCFSDKMLEFIPKLFTEHYGFKVVAVNDDYSEICAYSTKEDITVKVTQVEVNRTAVDFFISTRTLFDFGKTKKLILDIYNEISKNFEYLGVSLNSGTQDDGTKHE